MTTQEVGSATLLGYGQLTWTVLRNAMAGRTVCLGGL